MNNEMKRILLCSLILILSVAFLPSFAVNAAQSDPSPTLCIESDSERVFVGDIVTYSFCVENAPKVVALSLSPIFDSEVFEVVEAKWMKRATNQSIDETTYSATAFWFGLADINTVVYSITLRAIAPSESTSIDCIASMQGEDNTFSASVIPLGFTVTKCDHTNSQYQFTTSISHSLVCNDCGYTIESEHQLVPGVVVNADCINDGYTPYECLYCDYYEEQNVIKSDGHISGEWEIIDHPTTDSDGLKQRSCIVCGKVTESEVIPKLAPLPACKHETVCYYDVGGGYHRIECSDCDYETLSEHRYRSELLYDEYGHYSSCSDCENKTATVPHTLSEIIENNGDRHIFGCAECEYELVIISDNKIEFVTPPNEIWSQESGDVTLVFSEEFGEPLAIFVDGSALSSESYSADLGVIAIDAQYLSSLNIGTHSITVCFASGKATFELSVTETNQLSPIPDGSHEANDKNDTSDHKDNTGERENEELIKAVENAGKLLLAIDGVLLLILVLRIAICGLKALMGKNKR